MISNFHRHGLRPLVSICLGSRVAAAGQSLAKRHFSGLRFRTGQYRVMVASKHAAPSAPSANWTSLRKLIAASREASKRLPRAVSRSKQKGIHGPPTITVTPLPVPLNDVQRTSILSPASADFPRIESTMSRHRSRGRMHAGPSPEPSTSSPSALVPTEQQVEVTKNGESITALQSMVYGQAVCSPKQMLPGRYLALDCEMVGVGLHGGEESSLARVSIVNYNGAVQLDEIVKQREHVVDYRTRWSGIRESDMVRAKPFDEVQKRVADLLNNRILVGHAVSNDLKVLLLSHPHTLIRDTQVLAHQHGLMPGSRRPKLQLLAKEVIGVSIQTGEHSSVTDARATMAIFRVHRKEWEKGLGLAYFPFQGEREGGRVAKKRRFSEGLEEEAMPGQSSNQTLHSKTEESSGHGRKGVSSGLSVVVKRRKQVGRLEKKPWWKSMDNATASKGSLSMKVP